MALQKRLFKVGSESNDNFLIGDELYKAGAKFTNNTLYQRKSDGLKQFVEKENIKVVWTTI